MVWTSIAPNGTLAVKTNRPLLAGNTVYIETCQKLDHYWNEDANKDGHHKKIEMPVLATDPLLAASMDGAFYNKLKALAESPDNQSVQPFFRNASGIMQILGIRACGVFNVAGGAVTSKYLHNCSITRDALGRYHADFSTALPSVNYVFLGGGVCSSANTSDQVTCEVEANTVLANVKTVNSVKFRFIQVTSFSAPVRSLADPLQGYFLVFGG